MAYPKPGEKRVDWKERLTGPINELEMGRAKPFSWLRSRCRADGDICDIREKTCALIGKKQLLRRQVRSGQTNIFDFAGANGHEVAGGYRGRIEEEMTTAQIARATEPARKCMASDYENCEG